MKRIDHDISELKLDIIDSTGINTGRKIIIKDGVPHVYWLDLYRELGLSQQHAAKVIKKLTEGKHYIHLTRLQIRDIIDSNNGTVLPSVVAYYFINPDGWNRALMEIETDSMLNRAVANYIEVVKDQMASLFTRYEQGEVLSKELDTTGSEIKLDSPEASITNKHLAIANSFIRYACPYLKIDPGMVISASISHSEQEIQRKGGEADLSYLKGMIPRMIGDAPATLNPTQIGQSLGGMSAPTVNNILEQNGYQTFDMVTSKTSGRTRKDWKPTEKGEPYGEWKPVTKGHRNGSVHHEYRWYWKSDIIRVLRETLFPDSQTTITGMV
jgi:hypothetical protein